MRLTDAVAHEFSRAARDRGEQYVARGRVRLLETDADQLVAEVRGTHPYLVIVAATPEPGGVGMSGSCECPYAADHYAPCKHVWATLLAAERRGHAFAGFEPDGHVFLEMLGPDGDLLGPRPPARPPPPPPSPGRQLIDGFEAWLDERDATPAAARHDASELMYVLDVAGAERTTGATVSFLGRRRKRNGDWGKPRPLSISPADLPSMPPADRAVLAPLFGAARSYGTYAYAGMTYDPYGQTGTSSFALTDALAPVVVPALGASGRLFTRDSPADGAVRRIAWDDGPSWRMRPVVERTATGFQLRPVIERGDDRIAPEELTAVLKAGFLLTRDRLARLEPGDHLALTATIAAAGPVEVAERDGPDLARVLARAGVARDGLPTALQLDEVDATPVPYLDVAFAPGPSQIVAGHVTFVYDGSPVVPGGPAVTIDRARGRVIRRRQDDERAALDQLAAEGFRAAVSPTGGPTTWELPAPRFAGAARALLGAGWRIESKERVYRAAGAMTMSVSSGIDWFDLDGTVDFGGVDVPLGEVLAAVGRGEQTMRIGKDGIGLLPEAWLKKYGPLAATAEAHEDSLRFRRAQAALLDVLLEAREADAHVTVDEVFAKVRREIADFSRVAPADPPASFQGVLRDYQRDGLGWFQFLRRMGFGGCLADDMGLGKTVMVLALLAWRRETGAGGGHGDGPGAPRDDGPGARNGARPSLVVVPRSLVDNWRAEAARFTPALRVLDYSGTARRAIDDEAIGAADVVLATYGTVRRDVARLKELDFEYVVLDEAQAIKNAATASAKAARLLNGRHRLALSGTPIENHLGELWSLFDFLNPGLMGASSVFQRAASATQPDEETLALVARGLRPFILRRTKAQVARELPAKTEQTIACVLSKKERSFYDGLRRHYRAALLDRVSRLGLGRSQVQILEALLRLRQAACHPGLVDGDRLADPSAKLDVLVPRLAEVAAEGHKALVFSQFTSLLAILRQRLDEAGVTYEYLDGRTRKRGPKVDRFQRDPECPLFLISLKAGGLGLNLTAAEYVFLLDPWWNPAVEAQAIDRAHRIGQTREVFAYRLIAQDTVEEKVLELQQRKRALADAVLSADAVGLRHLTRDDLELLLS